MNIEQETTVMGKRGLDTNWINENNDERKIQKLHLQRHSANRWSIGKYTTYKNTYLNKVIINKIIFRRLAPDFYRNTTKCAQRALKQLLTRYT